MTSDDGTFGLPRDVRERVEARLARHPGAAKEDVSDSQVLFYDHDDLDFAYAWATADEDRRWIFPVEPLGPSFLFYTLKRLQDIGKQASQILIASRGQGALFYATSDDVEITSDLVVGLLPGNMTPYDFGSTVSTFAPGAVLTLLSDATAADTVYEEQTYEGKDLVGQLPTYICGFAADCGCTLASDQAVSLADDGTATTTGNIWAGDAATGEASILYPAPGNDEPQSFPLGADACAGPGDD